MASIRNLLIRVRGGEPLPAGVSFDLQRSERVLTWGRIAGGGIAAATDFGLRASASDSTAAAFHRWHEISLATWSDGTLNLTAMDGQQAAYRLTEPRGVPVAVREHVNATVVVSERHTVEGVGVRVVARRDLSNGSLVWSTVFESPGDADDPLLCDRADALLVSLRRRFGG